VARIGEILKAKWAHVDLVRSEWTLPDTKNGKAHTIRLNDFAVRQFERLHKATGLTAFCFPNTRMTDHVCEKTVTKQVADRQRTSGQAMTGRTQQTTALLIGEQWRPHDLRRTGATIMAELGALPDVIERCLNHTEENKMKRIYQRAQYEAPMREAWRMLGERLALLQSVAEGKTTNVVTLRKVA
jgi:integrase